MQLQSAQPINERFCSQFRSLLQKHLLQSTVKSRAVDRSTIQFLSILGVLLNETCYCSQLYGVSKFSGMFLKLTLMSFSLDRSVTFGIERQLNLRRHFDFGPQVYSKPLLKIGTAKRHLLELSWPIQRLWPKSFLFQE